MTRLRESTDYGAVFHILGAPAIRGRVTPFIRAGEIDWRGLLAEARRMSGGEALLVRIAHDLWQGERDISQGEIGVAIWEIPRRLDADSFERVLEALTVARTGSLPPRPAPAAAPRAVLRVA
jgi:hypothetical protein